MTEGKLTFRRVDAGCTANDYRARFTSNDSLVTVTMKWSPDKSYYRVYPVVGDMICGRWASPEIRISREFEGVKTPMELEALVIERMKGAFITGSEHDFTINWNGVPAFRVQMLGHKSVHTITTLYKDDPVKEFVLDDRSIKLGENHTGVIVDYNPHNPSSLRVVRADATRFIDSTIESE